MNFNKSELVLVGNVSNTQHLANTLGCKVAYLPMKYLGLSLGAASQALSICDIVIEKIERRLTWWKRLYLSKGDHVTLIKSTLSNYQFIFYLYFQF